MKIIKIWLVDEVEKSLFFVRKDKLRKPVTHRGEVENRKLLKLQF